MSRIGEESRLTPDEYRVRATEIHYLLQERCPLVRWKVIKDIDWEAAKETPPFQITGSVVVNVHQLQKTISITQLAVMSVHGKLPFIIVDNLIHRFTYEFAHAMMNWRSA